MQNRDTPEQPLEPSEFPQIKADCWHEVYEGEKRYCLNNQSLCPDCFVDEIKWFLDTEYPERLTLLADMLGVEYQEVS